ncbi:MAG: hypothetical protein KDJ90_14070 [Nitratireductor sp.]|nr:hypothetical protein [Nitratireductor sp.]
MNLSAPTTIVFWISVILFILSLVAQYAGVGDMLVLKPLYWGWLAWIVLAVGNVMKGL